MQKRLTILVVDDDVRTVRATVERLRHADHEVEVRQTVRGGMFAFEAQAFDLVITDICMPEAPELGDDWPFEGGIPFAAWVRKNYPNLPIILNSALNDQIYEIERQPRVYRFSKIDVGPLVRFVQHLATGDLSQLSFFLVHGRDITSMERVREALYGHLKCGNIQTLAEVAGGALTIIEKFERETQSVDMVLVLLSADDFGRHKAAAKLLRRARQNVIFELGYFVGKFSRHKSQVLLLKDGEIEFPSDIYGVSFIDVGCDPDIWLPQIQREVEAYLGFKLGHSGVEVAEEN